MVKYANVVSGDEGITMVVQVSGGQQACIKNPCLFSFILEIAIPFMTPRKNAIGVNQKFG